MLDDMVGDHTQEQAALDSLLKDGSDGDSLSVAHKEGIEAETGNRADARKAQVLDVAAEKARARKRHVHARHVWQCQQCRRGNQLNDDDKKLVTVLFHMFHKYVDESPFSLARRLLGLRALRRGRGSVSLSLILPLPVTAWLWIRTLARKQPWWRWGGLAATRASLWRQEGHQQQSILELQRHSLWRPLLMKRAGLCVACPFLFLLGSVLVYWDQTEQASPPPLASLSADSQPPLASSS